MKIDGFLEIRMHGPCGGDRLRLSDRATSETQILQESCGCPPGIPIAHAEPWLTGELRGLSRVVPVDVDGRPERRRAIALRGATDER